MMPCDKLKIAEYNEGKLSGADLFAVEEHLKECSECSAYQKSNEKLEKLLNRWEEKTEVSKKFDSNLLAKAEALTNKQKKISFIFASAWKTAVAFCLMLVVITAYKNTLYDDSLQNLKAISKTEFSSKIEIKDFKIFVAHRLCREMAALSADQKSLMNYEFMLSVPENILLEEQKSDLRELINEGVKNQEAARNIALRALDSAVNTVEEAFGVDFSFAATKGFEAVLPSTIYKQATLDFEIGKYETAFAGYYTLGYGQVGGDEKLRCSSLYRMAFIKDMLGSREEAAAYYKNVTTQYPASTQAIMSDEMGKFAKQKNSIEEKIKTLKGAAEEKGAEASVYFKIAGLYLSLSDYEHAAEYYKTSIDKTYGALAVRSRFNAGWCYKNTGNYKEAARMFSLVSPEPAYKLLADYELSLTYVKLGDIAKAVEASNLNENMKEENLGIYSTLIKKYFKAVNNGR